MSEFPAILRRLIAPEQHAGVLATLVSVSGSSYRRAGARLLITEEGQRLGSISGGCLEQDIVARAQEVGAHGRPEVVTYDTTSENDLVWGVGLGCHGVVQVLIEKLPPQPVWASVTFANLERRIPTELAVVWQPCGTAALGTYLRESLPEGVGATNVFLETVQPPVALVVFGAGDDARPVVRLAQELGWHVTVADPRADFATAARFPTAQRLIVAPATKLVSQSAMPPGAVAVVMTHHYVHDAPILRDLLEQDLAYVGLLGPRQRAERILADLAGDGAKPSAAFLQRLHAPVGLDLGADGAEEVALSIIAEIKASLSCRSGQPLRLRTRPIHGVP